MSNKSEIDYLGREWTMTRQFKAPRELVFRAWTDPKRLAQWWGPRGFTNPVCEWDARPGKPIHVVMRAPNGADFGMGGEFREVVPPERLVFTSGALDDKGVMLFEFLHSVTLEERDGVTTLTLSSRVTKTTADANKYIGGFEAGMGQSLDRLVDVVAGADNEIVISREFDAPRELVWEAMTNPKHVVNWWGPRGFTTTIEAMDVRVGGEWRQVMHGPDGANYPNRHVFEEIVKPERIVFSHGGRREGGPSVTSVATWTFEKLGERKTRVTIRMAFPSAAERDRVVKEFGAIEGARQTLTRLGEYLPTMAAA